MDPRLVNPAAYEVTFTNIENKKDRKKDTATLGLHIDLHIS